MVTPVDHPATAVCIYCSESKPKKQFGREHVFPAALTGRTNGMPTLKCVCRDCNQRLGDEVVSPFMRSSYEGVIQRGQFGLVESTINDEAKKINARIDRERVKTEFELDGLLYDFIGYLPRDSEHRPPNVAGPFGFIRIPIQVGLISSEDGPYEYFAEEAMEKSNPDLSAYFSNQHWPAHGVGPSEASAQRAVELARRLGAKINDVRLETRSAGSMPGEITINISMSLTTRFIGYICLNHAAWTLGANFALREEFDTLRQVILDHGDGTNDPSAPFRHPRWLRPNTIDFAPMLWLPGKQPERVLHHVVVMDLSADYKALTGRVSFFGGRTYEMTLAQGFSGIWLTDYAKGTHFDWKDGGATELELRHRYMQFIP